MTPILIANTVELSPRALQRSKDSISPTLYPVVFSQSEYPIISTLNLLMNILVADHSHSPSHLGSIIPGISHRLGHTGHVSLHGHTSVDMGMLVCSLASTDYVSILDMPTSNVRVCSVMDLNMWYKFQCCMTTAHQFLQLPGRSLVIRPPSLSFLLQKYTGWTVVHLRQLSDMHGLRNSCCLLKCTLYANLIDHRCTDICMCFVYLFEMCIQERTHTHPIAPAPAPRPVPSTTTVPNVPVAPSNTGFPTICSPIQKCNIIHQWQEEMDPAQWQYHACAVCGQKMFQHHLATV